jgi:hypothetical protein
VAKAPKDAHEWVSFEDEEEQRTWRFDLTFLESPWTCIFGHGCQGVLTEPTPELVQGCCSYGAHFVDEQDVAQTKRAIDRLTAEDWQFMDVAPDELIVENEQGDTVTVLHEDACIFLNRPGFAAGPGCAFHVAAERAGEHFSTWKPEVCWQLPLRREDEVEDDGWVTTSIGQWERRHWGAGGDEFAWWCTEEPAAYVGSVRVIDSMAAELVVMVGQRNYDRLMAYVDERAERLARGVPLAHPVVRRAARRAEPAGSGATGKKNKRK